MGEESNRLGFILRGLRGKQSLRDISERTGSRISHNHIGLLEKGIDPSTGKEVRPHPDTLMILSEVYKYPYIELMKAAGYYPQESNSAINSPANYRLELGDIVRDIEADLITINGMALSSETKQMIRLAYDIEINKLNITKSPDA